jgi:hypothetical protein
MFGRETINEKRSKAGTLVTRILLMAVAALFVMSFAYPAVANDNALTLKGEIVAVDNYAKTLTVKSLEKTRSSDMGLRGEFTFTMDKMTNVVSCTENKSLNDIGVGEKVTVTYYEKEGVLFADTIEIGIPIVVACYQ